MKQVCASILICTVYRRREIKTPKRGQCHAATVSRDTCAKRTWLVDGCFQRGASRFRLVPADLSFIFFFGSCQFLRDFLLRFFQRFSRSVHFLFLEPITCKEHFLKGLGHNQKLESPGFEPPRLTIFQWPLAA